MRNLMTMLKMFLLLLVTVVVVASCGDKDDVYHSGDYYYYLDIQSEVRLNLKEEDEEQGTMSNSEYDLLSKTILHMLNAVRENNAMQGDNRKKEAAMISSCDNLYREFADRNPENKGYVVCYVKLIRCHLRPNGTVENATAIKYYSFWWEKPEGGGNTGGGSSSDDYLAKPDTLQAVDLGLSVLWANCNIGAKQPRNYGAHLAWGDATGVLWSGVGIGWENDGYTWNTDNYGGNNPPADISGSDLDVVAVHWGDGWRMPTYSEAKELCELCQWKLQTYGDIKWYEVIGPNGNSIVMPLAGMYGDDVSSTNRFQAGPYGVSERGYYWTSTSCAASSTAEERGYGVNDGVVNAWCFRFREFSYHSDSSNNGDNYPPEFTDQVRAMHMSIRPVHNK